MSRGGELSCLPTLVASLIQLTVHKTPRRTVLIILVLIILTGSFFDSSEKPELLKAIDKPPAIHSQS